MVLMWKPERKRPLGRPSCRWDSGYGLERAGSGKGQVAGTCDCVNAPSGSIKCGEFPD
jgi:hypothetical protein